MYIYSIQKALIQVKLKDCLQIKFMEIKKTLRFQSYVMKQRGKRRGCFEILDFSS